MNRLLTAKQDGIEIGIKEEKVRSDEKLNQEKIKIAKNLLDIGLDIEKISKSTGLSIKEINELRIP